MSSRTGLISIVHFAGMSDDAKTPRPEFSKKAISVLRKQTALIVCIYIYIYIPGLIIDIPFAVFKTRSSPPALSNGIASVAENIWSIVLDFW